MLSRARTSARAHVDRALNRRSASPAALRARMPSDPDATPPARATGTLALARVIADRDADSLAPADAGSTRADHWHSNLNPMARPGLPLAVPVNLKQGDSDSESRSGSLAGSSSESRHATGSAGPGGTLGVGCPGPGGGLVNPPTRRASDTGLLSSTWELIHVTYAGQLGLDGYGSATVHGNTAVATSSSSSEPRRQWTEPLRGLDNGLRVLRPPAEVA